MAMHAMTGSTAPTERLPMVARTGDSTSTDEPLRPDEPGTVVAYGGDGASAADRVAVAEPARSEALAGLVQAVAAARPADAAPREAAAAAAAPTVLSATPALGLDGAEIALSAALFVAWISVITAGIAIGTQPYIDKLQNPEGHGVLSLAWAAVIVLTCHTVPNIAVLCCLSSFLGVIGSRIFNEADAGAGPQAGRLAGYVSAVTRGFFVYLIILSGTVVVSDEAFTRLSQEKYVRLAGLASLISFTIGYHPALFRHLLERVDSFMSSGPGVAAPGGRSSAG
jgi:hypothetical protein